MVLAEIDHIEASFVANIERGEQALAAAEDDYQRLEIRDAARAAQVVTAALGRRQLVRRFSVLVQRAERAIAQAHPPMTPSDRGQLANDKKHSKSSELLSRAERDRKELESAGLTSKTLENMRDAHSRLTDEEFEVLAGADTDEPMTRQQLRDLAREKRREEEKAQREERLEASRIAPPLPIGVDWAHIDGSQASVPESMLHELENGKNVIGVTDAIKLLQALPDHSIDLLLTDIPYARVNKPSAGLRIIDKADANEETFDLEDFASEVLRVTKGNAVIFCGKEQFSPLYQHFDERGFATRMIVWEKTNPLPMNGSVMFLSGVECAVHFRKERATFNEQYQNTVFRFPSGSSLRHPTEKPLDMFKRFVEILSKPQDLVCDPCMGSGTAAVAARQLGRRYLCSDINPENAKTALLRLAENN